MWWSETDDNLEPLCDAQGYFEATSSVLDAIHASSAPFDAPRWTYLREDLEYLRRYISHKVSGRVIDLGCGAGHWIDHYGESAISVDLVDFSLKLLTQAAQRAAMRWPQLQATTWPVDISAPGNGVPLSMADCIFTAFVLSHFDVEHVVRFLAGLRAAMKPGATLVVIDSWHSPTRRRHRAQETIRHADIDGRRVSILKHYFGRKEWEYLCARAELEIIDSWWGRAFFVSHMRLTANPADSLDRG